MRPTDERGRPIGASPGGLPAGEATRAAGGLKGIYPEFQVIRGFSQKILADLLSYDQIHS